MSRQNRPSTDDFHVEPVTLHSNDPPLIVRSLRNTDDTALASLSKYMRVHKFEPLDVISAYNMIQTWQRMQRGPIATKNGVIVSGPPYIHLAIVDTSTPRPHASLNTVFGFCAFDVIGNVEEDGRTIRSADLTLTLDPDFPNWQLRAKAVIKLLMDFGFARLQSGGLELDRIDIVVMRDERELLDIVTTFLCLRYRDAGIKVDSSYFWHIKKGKVGAHQTLMDLIRYIKRNLGRCRKSGLIGHGRHGLKRRRLAQGKDVEKF